MPITDRYNKIRLDYMSIMPEYYKQSDENRVFPVFAIRYIAELQLTIENLEARILDLEARVNPETPPSNEEDL